MSTCTKWVDTAVIACKDWASQMTYECTTWANENVEQCSQWADEGSSQCTSWEECHWYTPWNCIAGFFCRAYYWVAKWVCIAYYRVVEAICIAYAWVMKTICIIYGWVFKSVCVAWDNIRCALQTLSKGLLSLFSAKRSPAPKIEHVFVLMLENRSFDHMLGFSGIRGVDIHGNPTTIDGADPARDKNVNPNDGLEYPVKTPAEFTLKGLDFDPCHEFPSVVQQLCGGGVQYNATTGIYPPINNSGFIYDYGHRDACQPDDPGASAAPQRIMNCYDPKQLPVINALAREFALCDQWFSSLPGPTWPNRFFLLAATSGGLDGSPSKLDVVTSTTVEGYHFEHGNIFDLLDDHCINWRIFEGDDFPVSFAMSGMNLNALQGRFKDFDDFESELNKINFGDKFVFIEPKYGSHKFDITGPGDFTCGNSMHPLDDVTRGEALIKKVYETIRNSPHWEKSMLIITFDEHGGFYDHVKPPPAVPPGDHITEGYVQNHFRFDQLGVRVPALFVSPYTQKNVIDHTCYDHTSMLATVERLFGIGHLTERDKAAKDLLHLLSLETPRTDAPTRLPDPAINPHPLGCEDDDETEDELLIKRSQLRQARESGLYRDRDVREAKLTATQVGFVQIALMQVLQGADYAEKIQWLEQFKQIETGVDAAAFMTEAKLKLKHGVNLKKTGKAAQAVIRNKSNLTN